MPVIQSTPRHILLNLRASWRQLLDTHILGTVIAYLLLMPLASLALNLAVSVSGDTALSDQDILLFALRPVGLLALTMAAAILLTVMVFKYAAMLTVAFSCSTGQEITTTAALLHVAHRSRHILSLAARIIIRVLLYLIPFLGFCAIVYKLLLGDFSAPANGFGIIRIQR